MSSLLMGMLAGAGVYLLATSSRRAGTDRSHADGSASPRVTVERARGRLRLVLDQAGLHGVAPWQFVVASLAMGAFAGALTAAVFGAGLPILMVAAAATTAPALLWRRQLARRRAAARAAWPRLIEEIRVLTGSVGRSIPQALIEVGLRGPEELRPAFVAAQREWALTTDFERTVAVLKTQLADPTADAACETLLIAAEVGGDLDRRLQALAEDRRQDLTDRRDAEAKQSGARLARAFVIVVPAGMAVAGLSVGDGRSAYETPQGQLLVALGLAVVVICWTWAGRIMRLPEPERVLER
jgi:tight adherence protein B